MKLMKYYGQDKYFMDLMKYLNKGRNKNKNKNNFQTCRTVRDTLTVKKQFSNTELWLIFNVDKITLIAQKYIQKVEFLCNNENVSNPDF